MSFKPASANQTQDDSYTKTNWNAINSQVKGGSRPARISLIVDLGTQEREDFKEEYEEANTKHIKALKEQDAKLTTEDDKTFINIPQKPQPQIAVFVDLTNDVVDYGGEIGKQPYRLLLNKSFMGDLAGIGFAGCYSFDKKGQILKDKGFTFHSNSILTKLAKATKQTQIVSGSGKDNMDVSQLLGQPLMVTVDKTETTEGKVYLNYKGCSEVPMIPSDPSDPDSDEVMMTVKPLVSPALTITFDEVTEEDKKWLRGDLIKKIKAANDYEGSKMQGVVEAKVEKAEDPELPQAKPEQPDLSGGFDEDIPFIGIKNSHVLCI